MGTRSNCKCSRILLAFAYKAVEQVAFADRVLLNKTDLVNEETLVKIEGKVKGLNPAATIIRCSYCEFKGLICLAQLTADDLTAFIHSEGQSEGSPEHPGIRFEASAGI